VTIQKAFGIVLREVRQDRELSQERLALEADLDRTFVSLLERGQRQPSLVTLFSLTKVLRCRPSDLISKVEKLVKR